ncbi:MAG TPA: HAMP domain-containing sensor histidine kinase [Mycobacterium sp.]|nr:HAMP domain-containing sensor histidine kinase [Mycobacterium sp.]
MTTDADSPRPTPSWWRRLSLRARLTAAATIVIAIGMAAAAALLVWRVDSVQAANLDANLTQQINEVAADVAKGEVKPRVARSAGESTVLQVVDAVGNVISSSGDIDGEPRLFFISPAGGVPTLDTVTSSALDGPYRVGALAVTSPGGPVTVYVGSPMTPLADSTSELGGALIFGVPAMVALLALVGWLLVGRALRPVDVIRRQAAAIPGTDLQQRLDVPASDDELGRLAQTFNDLLERIGIAADRQRRFVADAAHELRTPLATLRARLEIDLRHPPEGEGDATITDTRKLSLQQVTRLAALVDDLLQLARLDADPRLHRRPVDLDDLVWETVREAREAGGPHLDTTGISPVRVLGDPVALHRVIRNLIRNAVRHADRTVTVRLLRDSSPPGRGRPASAGPTATLTIADDGPGIPLADRERVFERFVRLDEGRARDAGGAGLGLAIVADIVTAHGGRVRIDDNHPGVRVWVELPALP